MADERRLIDANALLEELGKFENPMPNKSGYDFLCGIATAITEIEDAPTADAVEVRCKDCTEWGGVPFANVCRRWSAPLAGMKNCTGPDDYCSYGKRRAGDGH